MLKLDHVSMVFGGLVANNDVSLEVKKEKFSDLLDPMVLVKLPYLMLLVVSISLPQERLFLTMRKSRGSFPIKLHKKVLPEPTRISICLRK